MGRRGPVEAGPAIPGQCPVWQATAPLDLDCDLAEVAPAFLMAEGIGEVG